MPKPAIPASERFWRKVNKTSGCWLWTGAKSTGRVVYGNFHPTKETAIGAHVYSWVNAGGEKPSPGFIVGHTCDNGLCVRNDDVGTYEIDGILVPRIGHLWSGTHKQNNRDMAIKGRRFDRTGLWMGQLNPSHKYPEQQVRGSKCRIAKLNEEVVLAIRKQFTQGNISKTELSFIYGVSEPAISAIISGHTWKHVGGPLVKTNGVLNGEDCHSAKLTPENVRLIRARFSLDNVSASILAR